MSNASSPGNPDTGSPDALLFGIAPRLMDTHWQRSLLGAWIVRESHQNGCACSYCQILAPSRYAAVESHGGHLGLALPQCRARNAWRILWWRRRRAPGTLHILRWTLPSYWPVRKKHR